MSQIRALPPIPTRSSINDSTGAGASIEMKLVRLEKVTETLLEEIVHLQGELNAVRKPTNNNNDELRLIRSQLKRITERQDQLQSRVINEEQKSLEKEQALTYLMQSSRDLEKKTSNNHQIILCRRDMLESQFSHVQNGVDTMHEKWRGYQDQLERKLSEDSERLENWIESVEMKHQEQLVTMRNMMSSLEVEQKTLAEDMNKKVAKLHQKLDHTNNKLSILASELLEQFDGHRRNSNQWILKVQEDVKTLARDLNKKIIDCSDAARDRVIELENAMGSLQQWCHKQHIHQADLVQHCEEQLDRMNKLFQVTTKTIQSTCESQANKRIEVQSKKLKDELNDKYKIVQGQLQKEKVKMSQLLAELHKSIDILQKEMEMTKEDTNKVIFAEIASRFREFDGMREEQSKVFQQLDQMRNELINFTTEHCRHEIEQAFHSVMDGLVNKLEVFDQVKTLRSQTNAMEEELKSRLSKLSCEHDQLQEDLLVWRKECTNNADDIQTTLSPLTIQFSQLEEQVEMLKQDWSNKMETEWLERRVKLKELQKQVSYCVTMDTYQQQMSSHDQRLLSLEGRVHNVAINNTKLENSLHKAEVKLVQQVSVEAKQRLSAIQQIKDQIALIQPHPQIRRTSSTTPVPATPTSRVRPHRKAAHSRYRLNSVSSRDDDDDGTTALIQQPETQGIFTSAPATPESQQNLIVQNLSHDDQSSPVSQYVNDEHNPLPEQFSPVLPSSASSNQEYDPNQQPPDQYPPNQQPLDQYPPNQQPLDQYPPNQQPLDQHSPNQQQPPDQISLRTSPTHSTN